MKKVIKPVKVEEVKPVVDLCEACKDSGLKDDYHRCEVCGGTGKK